MSRCEITVTLTCIECGFDFDSSARYARSIRDGLFPQRCKTCRRTGQARNQPTEADRQFWIKQFGLQGAVELSLAIWGDELERLEVPLLTAATK